MNEMNKMQICSWGIIVPWVNNAGALLGVVYRVSGRTVIAENRGDCYALTLNGREKRFPDRTTTTKWVKSHLA